MKAGLGNGAGPKAKRGLVLLILIPRTQKPSLLAGMVGPLDASRSRDQNEAQRRAKRSERGGKMGGVEDRRETRRKATQSNALTLLFPIHEKRRGPQERGPEAEVLTLEERWASKEWERTDDPYPNLLLYRVWISSQEH